MEPDLNFFFCLTGHGEETFVFTTRKLAFTVFGSGQPSQSFWLVSSNSTQQRYHLTLKQVLRLLMIDFVSPCPK